MKALERFYGPELKAENMSPAQRHIHYEADSAIGVVAACAHNVRSSSWLPPDHDFADFLLWTAENIAAEALKRIEDLGKPEEPAPADLLSDTEA